MTYKHFMLRNCTWQFLRNRLNIEEQFANIIRLLKIHKYAFHQLNARVSYVLQHQFSEKLVGSVGTNCNLNMAQNETRCETCARGNPIVVYGEVFRGRSNRLLLFDTTRIAKKAKKLLGTHIRQGDVISPFNSFFKIWEIG
jgi:hypothetical protein